MIETERLILRPCRDSDKPAFARILNTPAMMAHLGGVRSREAINALVDKRIAGQAKDGMSYWAVETKGAGELVGTCGVRIPGNYPGMPVEGMHEIGWRIGAEALGEAAEAGLVWA